MVAVAKSLPGADLSPENRLVLHGVTWAQYVALRDVLDVTGLHVAFCEGDLELMTPSPDHERAKTLVARLLEHYAFVHDLALYGYGSTTFRHEARERGLEPDESYYLGRDFDAVRHPYPDLAIEIVLSSGGMDKLAAYAGLGVREVWLWSPDDHAVYVLRGRRYERSTRSSLLPDLDLGLLAKHVWMRDQHQALRSFHDKITTKRKRPSKRARNTRG